MSAGTIIRKPSAFVPIVMSSIAILLVVTQVVAVGIAPQADEGTAAHIWQLLMVIQLPVIAYFGVRYVPIAPEEGSMVLATQIAFALAAAAPVFLLGF
ncbi:MAG TPA: hypothetical protein VGM49_07875 [Candidatus Limnocylindrales bacterium]